MAHRAFRAAGRMLKRPLGRIRAYPRLNARVWDLQYILGLWKYLDRSGGGGPWDVIERYASRPRVLDLGCGTSVNLSLPPGRYRHYHGVDISRRAIRVARSLRRADTSFEVADLLHYRPVGTYDVVLLREVLYYFPVGEIAGLLRRLAGSLSPLGVLLVSLYDSAPAIVSEVRGCGLDVLAERTCPPPAGTTIVLGLPGRDASEPAG